MLRQLRVRSREHRDRGICRLIQKEGKKNKGRYGTGEGGNKETWEKPELTRSGEKER
jgi:hypothetical protein